MADYAIHDTTLTDIANKIRKKDGTSALIDPADYADRIDLMGMLEVKSASGAIASISDGADDVALKDLIFYASPVQASGTPSPTNKLPISGHTELNGFHTGKNLLDWSNTSQTINQVTFTVNSDGTITVNGTATGGDASFYATASTYYPLKAGAYKISGCPTGGSNTTFFMNETTKGATDTGSGATLTLTEDSNIRIRITIRSGYNADNLTFSPMIEVGSTVSAFQAYSGETHKWTFPPFGKNLANLKTFVYGYVLSDGTFVSNHGQGEKRSDFIKVKPNTTYTFKVVKTTGTEQPWIGVGRYTASNTSAFITRQTFYNSAEASFTTESNCNYVVVSSRNLVEATEIQLEEGSQATAYEPYQEMYVGKVNALTGEVENQYKKIKVNSLSWTFYQPASGLAYCWTTLSDKVQTEVGDTNNPLYCDMLPYGGCNYASQFTDVAIWQAGNKNIYLVDSSCGDQNAYMSKYGDAEVLYSLANPAEVNLESVAWKSKLGVNNFYNDCGDTDVQYRSSGTVYTYPSGEGVSF